MVSFLNVWRTLNLEDLESQLPPQQQFKLESIYYSIAKVSTTIELKYCCNRNPRSDQHYYNTLQIIMRYLQSKVIYSLTQYLAQAGQNTSKTDTLQTDLNNIQNYRENHCYTTFYSN